MYLIDSTILVAELLLKYQQQDPVIKNYLGFYKKIPLMRRTLPDFVLNEFELYVMHVLPVRLSMKVSEKKQLHDVVSTYLRQLIHNCTLLTTNPQTMKTAFSLYNQKESENLVSFTDCLILAACSQHSYSLLTTDTSLQNYAAELRIPYYKP